MYFLANLTEFSYIHQTHTYSNSILNSNSPNSLLVTKRNSPPRRCLCNYPLKTWIGYLIKPANYLIEKRRSENRKIQGVDYKKNFDDICPKKTVQLTEQLNVNSND